MSDHQEVAGQRTKKSTKDAHEGKENKDGTESTVTLVWSKYSQN